MPPIDFARGDATALAFPAHIDAFLEAGPAFLTEAFRAFGSIAPDNEVTNIANCTPCSGGSTGHKYLLELDYAKEDVGALRHLFVKFSRDFNDERRDRQRTEMEGEAKLIALSRRAEFPVRLPTGMFADYEVKSGTGLVITERIFFGEGGIEPHRHKCFDHVTMADPLPYYSASISALARLAGAHKSGRLSSDVERYFPFGPSGSADPIPYNEDELRAELDRCAAFARDCRHLLPEEITTPTFLKQLERGALLIREHEAAIQLYLTCNPDLISLTHWNSNIDNLFFWQEGEALHCGLIDWGRAGQLTFGSMFWGGLSAADHRIWDRHFDTLIALFIKGYAGAGGPVIAPEELSRHIALHMSVMGVARMLAAPEIIRFRMPDISSIPDRADPLLMANDPAKNYFHAYVNFLKHWQRADFGGEVERLISSSLPR